MLSLTILKLRGSKMLFYHLLENTIFDKAKTPRICKLLSYSASVIENVHHALTLCPLSGYSPGSPETRAAKIQSRSS